MQTAGESDDIHTILGRFSRWTGKRDGNGKGSSLENLAEGVRELSYEEAMQQLRKRQRVLATRETKQVAISQGSTNPVPATSEAAQASSEPARSAAEPKQAKATQAAPKPARRKSRQAEPAMQSAKLATPTAQKQRKKTAAASPRGTSVKTRAAAMDRAATPEFRNVLTESLRAEKPAAIPVRARRAERSQRVSVRLSSDEESLLQQCAARAGVTVSGYLRMRALDGQRAAEPERKPSIFAPAEIPVVRSAAAIASAPAAKSGFGEWITLLRNRFLASPVRFAERA